MARVHPSQLPVLVASNHLPVLLTKTDDGMYSATWRGDRLLASTMAFSHQDLFRPSRRKIRFLGRVELAVPVQDQPAVEEACAAINCIPVFPSPDTDAATYDTFCSGALRSVFHNMVHPSTLISSSHDIHTTETDPWPAFLAMNKDFASAIAKAYAAGDILWLQDFDLVMVPHFLGRAMPRGAAVSATGLFLHVPFPSKSVLSTLPFHLDILRSMLAVNHVGFHIFEHARRFLDACESLVFVPTPTMVQGQLVLHHNGKFVHVTCAQLTIDAARVEKELASNTAVRDQIIRWRQRHKTIFAAVDVVDVLHGILQKCLAFHAFLKKCPEFATRVVLVQVGVITATLGSASHAQQVQRLVDDINAQYPQPVIEFIVRQDRMPSADRIALWRVAEVFVSTVFAEGLNTCPFEYIVAHRNATGLAILSQFAAARRLVHGAIMVNPWNIASIADAMDAAVHLSLKEKEFRRDCDIVSIGSHTPTRWATTILSDIAAAAHASPKKAMDILTKPLTAELLLDCYYKSRGRRVFFFDYYRTLAPDVSTDFAIVWPDVPVDVLSSLEQLCRDPRNTVFVVSGCNCELLSDKFGSVPGLGLVAEHGYFIRWAMLGQAARINKPWELYGDVFHVNATCGKWREKAEAIMVLYVDRTNGAALEMRRSSILFRYAGADYGFGLMQARELFRQLSAAFDGWPLSVIQGKDYIEVRPEGLGKGKIVKQIVQKLHADSIKEQDAGTSPRAPPPPHAPIDFVWTMGDDVADELMFDAARDCGHDLNIPYVLTCTVGHKSSQAQYYVSDHQQVVGLLASVRVALTKTSRYHSVGDMQSILAKHLAHHAPQVTYNTSALLPVDAGSSLARKASSKALRHSRGLAPVLEEEQSSRSLDHPIQRAPPTSLADLEELPPPTKPFVLFALAVLVVAVSGRMPSLPSWIALLVKWAARCVKHKWTAAALVSTGGYLLYKRHRATRDGWRRPS